MLLWWKLFQAVIMGIVEGLTEFLPVSSTGHLIIAGHLINFKGEFANMFEVVIQLGAILAIIVLFWTKIEDTLRNLMPGESGFDFWLKVLIAFIPSAVIGFLVNDLIDTYLFNPLTVAFALIIGGFLMIWVENKFTRHIIKDVDHINKRQAFWIGVSQCLALWPGMSRSSSTMMGGMMVGLSAKTAAEFSFFLAIPTMVAATGFSLIKDFHSMTGEQWLILSVGFVTSFIVALLVVKAFLGYLNKKALKPFAAYRIVVGLILIGMIFTGVIHI